MNMFNFFGTREINESLGIDIGPSSIKVVQLKRDKENIILETYGEIALGPYAGLEVGQATQLGDEKLHEALSDLFKEAKVSTKVATMSIDSPAAFVSMVTVPKVEESALRTMMPLEARKYIPIPLSEVQMDFWHIPDQAPEAAGVNVRTMQVVLAAVKNETLQMYNRLATRLGLEHVEFEIEGFSLVRSVATHSMGMTLVVDIGSRYTTVSLIRGQVVLDMHVISHGSQEGTQQLSKALAVPLATAEETKRTFGYVGDASNPYIKEVMELSSYPLFGEVARLSLMYERKYNQTIEGVILVGGGARVRGALEAYKQVVHLPAVIGTPFEQVKVPDFLSEMMSRIGPSYAVAVGLALKKLIS